MAIAATKAGSAQGHDVRCPLTVVGVSSPSIDPVTVYVPKTGPVRVIGTSIVRA